MDSLYPKQVVQLSSARGRTSRKSPALPGRIAVNGASAPRPCHIVDISGSHARLRTADPSELPDEFVLLLSADGKVHRRCKVIWRSNDELSVRFVPGPPPGIKPNGLKNGIVRVGS